MYGIFVIKELSSFLVCVCVCVCVRVFYDDCLLACSLYLSLCLTVFVSLCLIYYVSSLAQVLLHFYPSFYSTLCIDFNNKPMKQYTS